MRRFFAILTGAALMLAMAGPAQAEGLFDGSAHPATAEIVITAAGDMTIGGNMRKNPKSNMYIDIVKAVDGDLSYFLANVQEFFGRDDLTIVNFEGALTHSTAHKDNDFCFRAPPEHVRALSLGSVEAVSFENNHAMDFKQQGYDDTIAAFNGEGIVYSTKDHMGIYEVKGVRIGMLAYQTFDGAYDMIYGRMPGDIMAARAQGCGIVIVSYHWGAEKDYAPNSRQVELGRATIDAGADLVLGHHSHRINPIEHYQGKYIVYSLGNSSFSGNTQPSDMDTFLFQQKFIVSGGMATSGPFRIIPCSISSKTAASGEISGKNDLAVTPFAPDSKGVNRVINTMLKNGQKLKYAVESYPTGW